MTTQAKHSKNTAIDKMVAEKIFGAKVATATFNRGLFFCDFPDRKIGEAYMHLPPFSSCPLAVSLLLREIKGFSLTFQYLFQEGLIHLLNLDPLEASSIFTVLTTATPEDICRAALYGVGALKDAQEEITIETHAPHKFPIDFEDSPLEFDEIFSKNMGEILA